MPGKFVWSLFLATVILLGKRVTIDVNRERRTTGILFIGIGKRLRQIRLRKQDCRLINSKLAANLIMREIPGSGSTIRHVCEEPSRCRTKTKGQCLVWRIVQRSQVCSRICSSERDGWQEF